MENKMLQFTLELISIGASIITLLWAIYHAHTAESRFGKLVFAVVILAFITMIVTSVSPTISEMSANGATGYVWQRVFARSAIALFNIYDFSMRFGTEKWRNAFINTSKILPFTVKERNLLNIKRR